MLNNDRLGKTQSLTHNCDRMDRINRRNQGCSSKSENHDSWSSSVDFFLVDRQNLDLKHSSDA